MNPLEVQQRESQKPRRRVKPVICVLIVITAVLLSLRFLELVLKPAA